MKWINELYNENFLSVYDVVLDIESELQMMNGDIVVIPLLPSVVKFQQLMPGDGINLRDRYCEL